MKKLLRNPDEEHTLLINGKGEYELVKYEQVTVGDGSSGVRAFVFRRKGFSYAVVWDVLGSSVMELDIPICSYTKEVDTLPIEYGFSDGKAVLPVSSKGYIKTEANMPKLISALKQCCQLKRCQH